MSPYELGSLILGVALPILGVTAWALRWALRMEFARRDQAVEAGDERISQGQQTLAARVDAAHQRIDGVEADLRQIAQEMVRREDYVPGSARTELKLDALATAVARLEALTQ